MYSIFIDYSIYLFIFHLFINLFIHKWYSHYVRSCRSAGLGAGLGGGGPLLEGGRGGGGGGWRVPRGGDSYCVSVGVGLQQILMLWGEGGTGPVGRREGPGGKQAHTGGGEGTDRKGREGGVTLLRIRGAGGCLKTNPNVCCFQPPYRTLGGGLAQNPIVNAGVV